MALFEHFRHTASWLWARAGRPTGARHHAPREQGVTAVLLTMMMTLLIASAGVGVDTASLAFQRGRVQHSADAAAMAVAQDCALQNSACTAAGARSTGTYYANQNSPGGVVPADGVSLTSTSVRVDVDRATQTPLMGVVGVPNKVVHASATATWNGHPLEGTTMLPMGVPYCMYKNNLPPATTPILLRSDVISVVFNVIVQGGAAGRLITTLLGDLLSVTDSCTTPEGVNLKMLRGPIWLSGLEGAVNGAFNWNSSVCNMHLGTIDGFLGSTVSSVIPSNCVNRLGTMIKKGQIITLPIYQPSISLQQLGLEMDACLLGICSAKIPPRLGVKVIGFAPFRITGWNYPTNSNPDPTAPACFAIDLLVHPAASIGCNGIQGYFLKTVQTDPNFTYSPTAGDYGANSVILSN